MRAMAVLRSDAMVKENTPMLKVSKLVSWHHQERFLYYLEVAYKTVFLERFQQAGNQYARLVIPTSLVWRERLAAPFVLRAE